MQFRNDKMQSNWNAFSRAELISTFRCMNQIWKKSYLLLHCDLRRIRTFKTNETNILSSQSQSIRFTLGTGTSNNLTKKILTIDFNERFYERWCSFKWKIIPKLREWYFLSTMSKHLMPTNLNENQSLFWMTIISYAYDIALFTLFWNIQIESSRLEAKLIRNTLPIQCKRLICCNSHVIS